MPCSPASPCGRPATTRTSASRINILDPSTGTIDEAPISSSIWLEGYRPVAPVRIYQQNVYVGTDVDAVIAAGSTSSDPAVLFGALIGALNTFDATDWNARAGRMADEFRYQGPDVISVNEISTVSRRGLSDYGVADHTTDFLPGLPGGAHPSGAADSREGDPGSPGG